MDRLRETDITQYRDLGYVVPNLTLEDVSLKRIERLLSKFPSDNSELTPRYVGGLLEIHHAEWTRSVHSVQWGSGRV